MIIRFFSSLVLGIVVLLMAAEHSAWVHRQAAGIFNKAFGDAVHCTAIGTVSRVSFFWPEIEISNMVVSGKTADDGGWSWQCKRYRSGFSWLHLLRYGVIDMWIEVDHPSGISTCSNNKPAISNHIAHMLETPDLPIPTVLKSVQINHGSFKITDGDNQVAISWHSNSKLIDNNFKTRVQIVDANLIAFKRTIFERLKGDSMLAINLTQSDACPEATAKLQWSMPHLADSTCFGVGSYAHNNAVGQVYNATRSLRIDPIKFYWHEGNPFIECEGNAPLSFCWNMLFADAALDAIAGQLSMSIKGNPTAAGTGQLHATLANLSCYSMPVATAATISIAKNGSALGATLGATIGGILEVAGTATGDINTQSATINCTNKTAVPIAHAQYWHVLPHNFSAEATIKDGHQINGSYACTLSHTVLNTSKKSAAQLHMADTLVQVAGTVDDHSYDATFDLDQLRATSFAYRSPTGTPLITVSPSHDSQGYLAAIDVCLLRSTIQNLLSYDVQAEGIIQAEFVAHNHLIQGKIHLKDGTIRLPETYNFMHGFDAHVSYDWAKDYLCISNLDCQLYSGTLSSSRVVAHGLLGDQTKAFVHAPCIFKRCLLNRSADLFGIISGNITLEQRAGKNPSVRGTLLVDRSQLKENIFSDAVQRRIFQGAFVPGKSATAQRIIECDLAVHTKDHIRIDTDFLQTSAQVALSITNNSADPHVQGFIKLNKGSLKFPYKPLHITRGIIQFMPNQPNNPLIELAARNVIKKHTVTLQVTGSLHDHHIQLESNPPLSQEQIIGLLFAGVAQDSLTAMMPALIMQNMRQLLFGAEQSKVMDKLFKPLFKQFNVSLVPSFSDQTGRGGLRGALEIEVNDRWRALIQKNFSLTEDTRLELEYLLSDDISVRAIRDERRDLGAEVEMRWKF